MLFQQGLQNDVVIAYLKRHSRAVKWVVGVIVIPVLIAVGLELWENSQDKSHHYQFGRALLFVHMDVKKCPAKNHDLFVNFSSSGSNPYDQLNADIYLVPATSRPYGLVDIIKNGGPIPPNMTIVSTNRCAVVKDKTFIAVVGTYRDAYTEKSYTFEEYFRIGALPFNPELSPLRATPEEIEYIKSIIPSSDNG